jgi:hypothetical protein
MSVSLATVGGKFARKFAAEHICKSAWLMSNQKQGKYGTAWRRCGNWTLCFSLGVRTQIPRSCNVHYPRCGWRRFFGAAWINSDVRILGPPCTFRNRNIGVRWLGRHVAVHMSRRCLQRRTRHSQRRVKLSLWN